MQNSLLKELNSTAAWESFYNYKLSLSCVKPFADELRAFIDAREYEAVYERIISGQSFPLPVKSIISKQFSGKKRVVYTYPDAENIVLKHLTYLISRKYDALFTRNLYSFRPGYTAKDAIRRLIKTPGMAHMYAYKADISDYFNSIPVEKLLPELEQALSDDKLLCEFLRALLSEDSVLYRGSVISETKGIMAGTPQSSFFANLYLNELDKRFERMGVCYARYSDDIIVFGKTREETQDYACLIREFLLKKGLRLNAKKEMYFEPGTGWSFLGFDYRQGTVDVCAASVDKLMKKMRRKMRALKRWQISNGLEAERAAKAFIRVFNRKLLESPLDNELSWQKWFFSVINTTQGLLRIDRYAQECLRYLLSGTRTKKRYNVRYETLKELGYRSLVHEYYAFRKQDKMQKQNKEK